MIKYFLLFVSSLFLAVPGIRAGCHPNRLQENTWESEIKKFEESDRLNPPTKGAVLFIGSSSIRLWTTLQEDFPGIKLLNRGFGGSEIADSTYFADRIVFPYKPRMIVLYAGDNDLANGKTTQEVFEAYKKFVAIVRAGLPGVKIAFISIKPSLARIALLQKMKEANDLIREYSKGDKNLIFIDVFSSMLGEDGKPRASIFGPDGLHMNREGYEVWRKIIGPYLMK